MTQGLDYSAARLSGQAIKQAGYDFVIRYVGTPGRTKNIVPFEYQDLTASGVAVALVYENVAEDALGGFAAGQGAARAARTDADSIGFPANRPIYFAVDWVATSDQMPAVMAYLDGAASVLGVEHIGVYGFQLTVQTAMQQGKARWFWQCGARSALVPGTHLYQHNNDNTSVSGITCDVNDALADDFGQDTGVTDMLTPEQDKMLREAHAELTKRLPSRVPGSTYTDTILGYAANSDMYGNQLVTLVATLAGKVDGLTAALAQLGKTGVSVDLAAVSAAAEAGARKVFVGATWSGTGTFSPSQTPVQPAPATPPGGTK